MKRFLLAAVLGTAGLFASTTAAQAQRPDSTYVKPQLPTGPPAVPPSAPPTRPVQPTQTQPQQPAPQQPQPPVRPSGGIDDDGRSAQPLPGSRPTAPSPTRPGGGIDDDGRPAQTIPKNGTVPGATQQPAYQSSKFFIYSNFNLGLNSNEFNGIDFTGGVSPALGYRVTEKFAVGPGLVYTYGSTTFDAAYANLGFPKSIKTNSLGVKGFAQFMVYKGFFLHGEYEVTRAETYGIRDIGTGGYQVYKVRATSRALLGGVGYRQQISDRFAADIAGLYNFNYNDNYYNSFLLRFSLLFDIGK